MITSYSPEICQQVLGENRPYNDGGIRSPLNIVFSGEWIYGQPEILRDFSDRTDPDRFNAVGSKILNRTNHLPVIDADYGAFCDPSREGRKVVIKGRGGRYLPSSLLVDVLEDNQMSVEIFSSQHLRTERTEGIITERTKISGPKVGAIVLRSRREGIFEVVDSNYLPVRWARYFVVRIANAS